MHIRDWQSRFAKIYPNSQLTPDYIMIHLATKCSMLTKSFLHRSENHATKDATIVQAISWLAAISSYFRVDYERALIARFPGACSYCLRAPCVCADSGKRALDRFGKQMSSEEVNHELEAKRNSYFNTGFRLSFDEFRNHLFRIYPGNRYVVGVGYYAHPLGKLQEEQGELHRAYSEFLRGETSTKVRIETEIADVSAWLVTLWDTANIGKNLDTMLADHFRYECPACRRAPCECPRYSITMDEDDAIRQAIVQLQALRGQGTVDSKRIEEAVDLFKDLSQTSSEVSRADKKHRLRDITAHFKDIPNVSEGLRKTVEAIEKVISILS
ncbi:MAG: hypothetical protein U1E21_04810 [Reyranellaceae bacterium]